MGWIQRADHIAHLEFSRKIVYGFSGINFSSRDFPIVFYYVKYVMITLFLAE